MTLNKVPPRQLGFFRIIFTADDCNVLVVDGAFKFLTSSDPAIRSLTSVDLKTTAYDRIGHGSTSADVERYLNATHDGEFEDPTNRHAIVYTRARIASGHIGCVWAFEPDINITLGGTTSNKWHRQMVCRKFTNFRYVTGSP